MNQNKYITCQAVSRHVRNIESIIWTGIEELYDEFSAHKDQYTEEGRTYA